MLPATKGKGIICGEHDFSFPAHMNYGIYFVGKILNFKDKRALINGVTGEEVSFAQLAQEVGNVSASLTDLGMKKGDVAAVISENRNEYLTATLATMCAGGVVTFINNAYTASEIIHAAKVTKPKYVFISTNVYKSHYNSLKTLDFVSKIIIFADSPSSELVSYNQLVNNNQADFSSFVDYYGRVETALILFSSGTTGLPKGAKITHVNLMSNVQQDNPFPNLSMLTIAPWSNTIGFATLVKSLFHGITVVYLPRFQEKQYLETIQKYKVQSIIVPVPLVVWLGKSPLIEQYDMKSVEIIYTGGAPLDENGIEQVRERLPHLRRVLVGYGMTEATGAVTEETELEFRTGSVGKVVQGNVIKVVDVESRKTLGPGQPGEVCINGVALFDGYIGRPKSEDFDDDGFYRTGDIAYYDQDGYFYIIDRLKELIKYKGWQVSPAELEGIVLEHPAVRDVGVAGAPDPLAGELPTAFVVKQPGASVTEKEIKEFVTSKVSPWKQLRGGVRFVNEIPKNPSGKILRRILRDILKTKSKI